MEFGYYIFHIFIFCIFCIYCAFDNSCFIIILLSIIMLGCQAPSLSGAATSRKFFPTKQAQWRPGNVANPIPAAVMPLNDPGTYSTSQILPGSESKSQILHHLVITCWTSQILPRNDPGPVPHRKACPGPLLDLFHVTHAASEPSWYLSNVTNLLPELPGTWLTSQILPWNDPGPVPLRKSRPRTVPNLFHVTRSDPVSHLDNSGNIAQNLQTI